MKKLFFAIATILLMVSCSNDEIINDTENGKVKFGTVIKNNVLKVATPGLMDLTTLKTSGGFVVCTSGLGTGMEMNNVVVKHNSVWEYTGDYFWPLSPIQDVNFTAYAPAGTDGVTLSGTGMTVHGFIPVSAPENQIDLLYAAPAAFNRNTSGTNGVVLAFEHKLTQIVFSVTTDIAVASNPKISSIVLNVAAGTGAYDHTTNTWSVSGGPQSYTVFNSNPVSATAITSAPLLMIPQTLTSGTTATITFSVADAGGGGATATYSNTVDLSLLPLVKTWDMGSKITYNIAFNNADLKIKFGDPTISTWNIAGDNILY